VSNASSGTSHDAIPKCLMTYVELTERKEETDNDTEDGTLSADGGSCTSVGDWGCWVASGSGSSDNYDWGLAWGTGDGGTSGWDKDSVGGWVASSSLGGSSRDESWAGGTWNNGRSDWGNCGSDADWANALGCDNGELAWNVTWALALYASNGGGVVDGSVAADGGCHDWS